MNGELKTRVGKQRFREARLHVQDYIILLIAGACLGVLSNMKDINLGSQGYHFTVIALGTRVSPMDESVYLFMMYMHCRYVCYIFGWTVKVTYRPFDVIWQLY